MKDRLTKIFHVTLAVFAIVMAGFLSTANAQSPASSPCDPDYYKSLKARAWLEAQREITQNQNLIAKPDSVLEYTCFDKQLREVASHAPDMFSESLRWGGSGSAAGMGTPLNAMVLTPMVSYLLTNFKTSTDGAYGLLGGRSSMDSDVEIIPGGGGTYNCDVMNRVWMEAKCKNFVSEADDGFFTFEEYVSGDDKRKFPASCIKPVGLNSWDNNLKQARNTTSTPVWEEDPVNAFIAETTYGVVGDCTSTNPVPTGVQIFTVGNETLPEKVCVMPGCFYEVASNSCVDTLE